MFNFAVYKYCHILTNGNSDSIANIFEDQTGSVALLWPPLSVTVFILFFYKTEINIYIKKYI